MREFFKNLLTKENKFAEYSNSQLRAHIADSREYIRTHINLPQYTHSFFGSIVGLFDSKSLTLQIRKMEAELDRRERAQQQSQVSTVKKI